MRDGLAIDLQNVTKTYRLFGSQRQQLFEVLGLHRLGIGRGAPAKEFHALSGLSLQVPKGARIGVLGRNGAGKTTLLKLISGNFEPTSGSVEVTGTVQALMGTGLGFHPEYTGRENAMASLQYNGLARAEYDAAMDDILAFCELGDFIDQPFRTYSLGMQARLMFATATAVRPDILIVDEVLGAGDGRFITKSRQRMEKLVSGGCTMLLVSHSTQQVLELCHEAIWLDQGRIRMQGDAFAVVKAYEEYIYGANVAEASMEGPALYRPPTPPVRGGAAAAGAGHLLQEPIFQPNGKTAPALPPPPAATGYSHPAEGGISRWDSEPGVKVRGVRFVSPRGEGGEIMALEPLEVHITVEAEADAAFRLRYGFICEDMFGRPLTRVFSPEDAFEAKAGDLRTVRLVLNPLQVGSGEYVCGVCVLEYGPLELVNSARRYDLLNKSFRVRVAVPDTLLATDCLFYHSGEWDFNGRSGEPPAV